MLQERLVTGTGALITASEEVSSDRVEILRPR